MPESVIAHDAIPPLPLPPLPMGSGPAGYDSPATDNGPARNRVWTVFVVFLGAAATFVILNIVGGVLAAVIVLRGRDDIRSMQAFLDALPAAILRPGVIISLGLAGQVTLLAWAVGAAILSPVPFAKRLRLTPSTLPIAAYPLVMMGALAVGVLYSQLIELLHVKPNGALKIFDELLHNLTPMQVVAAVLVLGVMPGFAEEWLFRGYIQTRLSRAWGRWRAIHIAAALFGIMHMDPWQSPFAALFGVYLGYLAEKSGSIRPTMICHIFNNSAQILMATVLAPYMTPAVQWGIVICCMTALPASIVYLRFWVQPPGEQQPLEPLPILAPLATAG
ncbi:MAG TPA: type II CAAX endopeptidase family protein [Tepidisphaeraceae bacterium]|nr:type II CAAX endopeptidase family protein [Tepidisphaeraceae bacterium]